jgi:hypothetical protein
MNLGDLASIATIGALVVSLGSLAFSSRHYLRMRETEQKHEAFSTYHELIKHISRGADDQGPFKLVSQMAYIYELRNFPDYEDLTRALLMRLRAEWAQNVPGHPNNEILSKAIDETLAYLVARH